MALMGFRGDLPRAWSRLWLAMWLIFTGVLVYLAFNVPFWPHWVLASIPLFLAPEMLSIWRKNDSFPPLTHTIRHFLPNWVAFPLIYFLLGSVGARALGFDFPRNLHVGGLFGLLGWLTDHFSVTYAEPDPFPFSGADTVTAANAEPRRLTL